MGLTISHNAFDGSYASFNRFRQAVCRATGGSFPPHDPPVDEDGTELDHDFFYWECTSESHPGLYEFLKHSDCDGEISPELCANLAEELKPLVPAMHLDTHGAGGHIERMGGYGTIALRLIQACEEAHALGEPLIFH